MIQERGYKSIVLIFSGDEEGTGTQENGVPQEASGLLITED